MSELVVWPKADLSGAWQQGTPLVVDGGTFLGSSVTAVDSAGYEGADSAADAFQGGLFTLPTVQDDQVALLVTAVTDETETAAVGTAPRYGIVNKRFGMFCYLPSGTFTLTFEGQTTAAIDWDATIQEVATALEALSNVEAGEVTAIPDETWGPSSRTATQYLEFAGQWAGRTSP